MKFSSTFASFCGLVALAGCAYIIPPEDNAPRNNTVLGEPHRPQLNNAVGANMPQSDNTPKVTPVQAVAQNDLPPLPPVDAATKAEAQQEMAQADHSLGARRVPMENAQFQVSANDYPPLTDVPERPPLNGPDSTKERLGAVRTDLEQDRANAQASSDALARDAAAEPSMLAPMPGTNTPPAITSAPLSAPATPKPIHLVPPGASAAPNGTQSQAMLSFAPADTSAPGSVNFPPPAPLNAASMPITYTTGSAAPVMMRPIENPVDSSSAPAPMALASATRPMVLKGDFDPLAAADNAPIAGAPVAATTSSSAPSVYASDGYMAASRYAGRRYQ